MVKYSLGILKKIFFWRYARNSWQWDVLCVLILIFIFLTPKSWFESGERQLSKAHPNRTLSTVLIAPETIVNEANTGIIEDKIRAMTGRNDTEVVSVRKVIDSEGKTRGYEVDIR